MDWTLILTTVVGAVIGVGSALLVERSKSNRERGDRWEDLKRQSYVEFMVALNHTHQALCAVGYLQDVTRDTRATKARDEFRSNGIYAAYEQLMLVAPEAVRAAAEDTFRQIRKFRDRLDTNTVDPDSHRAELDQYRRLRDHLREIIRDDLRRFGHASPRRTVLSAGSANGRTRTDDQSLDSVR